MRTAHPKLQEAILCRYEYHERTGILEYDARLPRDKAEQLAAAEIETGTILPPFSENIP